MAEQDGPEVTAPTGAPDHSWSQGDYRWERPGGEQKRSPKTKDRRNHNETGGGQSCGLVKSHIPRRRGAGGDPQPGGSLQWQRFSPESKGSEPHIRLPSPGVLY